MSTPISQTRADLVPLIANKYRDILRDLGEDTNREGLLDTPSRAAQALLFFTKVINIQNIDVRFYNMQSEDDYIVLLLPFTGLRRQHRACGQERSV